jgi:hypothetical protein
MAIIDCPIKFDAPEEIKYRKVQCMHCPRYMYRDKVSKINMGVDDSFLNGSEYHIHWKTENKKGYCFPQVDIIAKSKLDAFRFAITIAREGRIGEFDFGDNASNKILRIIPQ